MDCVKCSNQIPDARLKALPSAKTCVSCSTTQAVACHVVITGKTEYCQIQIVDQETSARMKALGSRTGFGIAKGVKFQFDSRSN